MANGGRRPVQGQPVPATASPPPADRGSPPGSDAQVAALVGVTARLVQQIAVQTGALSANTAALMNASRQQPGRGGDRPPAQPPRPTVGPAAGGAAGLLAGGMSAIVTQLIAPLAPLAALAQVISATTSGFGTFLKMTQLITTSLAGLFLPATMVAGGAVFALSETIRGPLLGAMEKLTPQMIALKEATEGVAGVFDELSEAVKLLAGDFDPLAGTLGGVNDLLNVFGFSLKDIVTVMTAGTIPGLMRIAKILGLDPSKDTGGPGTGNKKAKPQGLNDRLGDALFDLGLNVPRYNPPAGPTPEAPREGFLLPPGTGGPDAVPTPEVAPARPTDVVGGFGAKLREGMNLMMQSMKRDVGGQAQSGQDLSGVWRAATMAGLSVDPIQTKISQTMIDQLAVMEKMLAEIEKREAQYK